MKRIRMEAEHRALLEQHKVEQQKILENEQRIQHAHEPDSIEKAAWIGENTVRKRIGTTKKSIWRNLFIKESVLMKE